MAAVPRILSENIDIVFFVYGMAFVLLGATFLIQRKKDSRFKLAETLWLLGVFGIVHALNEFLQMWGLIRFSQHVKFPQVDVLFLAFSFAVLFEYGRRSFGVYNTPVGLFCPLKRIPWYALPFLLVLVAVISGLSQEPLNTARILSRYLLGFPGAVLAGTALLCFYRSEKESLDQLNVRGYFLTSGMAFIAYGIFSGLIVDKGGFFPSNVLNTGSFFLATGIPVQLFRAACAVAISWGLLSGLKIFHGETEKALRDAVHELHYMVDFLPDPTFVIDTAGKVVAWNRAMEKISGVRKQEIVGKGNFEYSIPLYGARRPILLDFLGTDKSGAKEFYATLKNQEGILSAELFLPRLNNGAGAYVSAMAAPLLDSEGKFCGGIESLRDITELKRAEEELRFANTLLLSQNEASLDGTLLVDESGKIVSFNTRFTEIWGIPPEVIASRSDERALQAILGKLKNPEEFLARVKHLYAHREEKSREDIALKDGRTLDRYSAPMLSSDGKYYGRVWHFRDITVRKNTEAELDHKNGILRSLLDNTPVGVFMVEAPSGKPIFANSAALKILGRGVLGDATSGNLAEVYKAVKIPGKIPYPPEEMPILLGMRGETSSVNDMAIMRPDGTEIMLEVFGSPVSDAEGKVWASLVSFLDITKRKKAEAERERLLTAIDQAGESVTITDTDGNIQYVNPAFQKITGYAFAEVAGRNSRILKSGRQDGAFYEELWGKISSGRTWEGRLVNKRKDGTLYTVDATISPVRDPGGKTVNYVAVNRDISAQLQLENQFRQAQKMEAVGVLSGGVAHDFNNILTAITAYAGFIHKDLAPEDPMRSDAQEILAAADRAAALTRQLLAFSRKQVLSPRAVDLNHIINGLTNMLKRLLREDIELNTKLSPAPCRVMADPGQLEQVLMNLVVNARDAMPNGGTITLATDIVDGPAVYAAHSGLPRGPLARLSISDTGCGMTDEVKEHLFEPFFTTKEKGMGTGLGLSTVFGIVKQSGGDIDLQSELDRGTTFRIYLPRIEAVMPDKENVKAEAPRATGNETVLFVEDEDSLRRLGERVLREDGYTVLVAADGRAALKLMEERGKPVDLLITDLVMPGMSGRELAIELARRKLTARTLYMSGYAEFSTATPGVLEPGAALIYKPFSVKALSVKLREVLDGPADKAKA